MCLLQRRAQADTGYHEQTSGLPWIDLLQSRHHLMEQHITAAQARELNSGAGDYDMVEGCSCRRLYVGSPSKKW